MELPSKIRFVEAKTQKAFQELENSSENNIYNWLIRAFEDIEKNAFFGVQIPKRLIPKEYQEKYKTNNLWKYNLPNAWRLLYSIENQEIIVVSIILEWLDHKDYERLFNY